MIMILFATIFFLLLLLVFILARQYYFHKRIKEMIVVTRSILDGEKRQIFSTKEDELGTLSYEINQLASMYDKSQIKYENELFVKKQLISNLSHDVRTPLVSVIGYLEAIVENRIDGEQKDDYIDTAYQKAILLKDQVNQLFEFVQSDANEISLSIDKVDVCELTRQIVIDFLPVIENEGIELNIHIPDDEIFAMVDKDSFVRVVQNVVKNSLTHAIEGKYLGVSLKKDAGCVFIDVADKGNGIGKEHMPYIFERLYKVDTVRSRGGGLGLAIAKELSNKMNGDVEILRSIPGDTVFLVLVYNYGHEMLNNLYL